jgi:hypothetical protein
MLKEAFKWRVRTTFGRRGENLAAVEAIQLSAELWVWTMSTE